MSNFKCLQDLESGYESMSIFPKAQRAGAGQTMEVRATSPTKAGLHSTGGNRFKVTWEWVMAGGRVEGTVTCHR